MTKEEEEAKRKAEEEEAQRKAAESDDESSDDEEELSVDDLKAQLAESRKHIKKLNGESAERRKKLEEFEKLEEERKQADLSEKEKAEARALKLEEEKQALARENQNLKLRQSFESKVRDANLQFKNSLAAKDAFNALTELLEEGETEVTDDHIKKLTRDRDYLFGKADTTTVTNDGSKKGKSNQAVTSQEAIAAKKKTISPL